MLDIEALPAGADRVWVRGGLDATLSIPLRRWGCPGPDLYAGDVARSGVAFEDLRAWCYRAAGCVAPYVVSGFADNLVALRERWPDLALDGAVGWLLASQGPDTGSTRWPQREVVKTLMGPWDAAGVLADGWLYVAAGLTLGGAVAARRSGSVDLGGLRVLAALRDVALPIQGS
jgi:hypothetical protein